MAVKNPTIWTPPSGRGYVKPSSLASITTESGLTLTTESGTTLTIEAEVYQPVYATGWTKSGKNKTIWQANLGNGYPVTIGNLLFTDNTGNFIVTNSGNNIVTNPTVNKLKSPTLWAATGA